MIFENYVFIKTSQNYYTHLGVTVKTQGSVATTPSSLCVGDMKLCNDQKMRITETICRKCTPP